MDAYTLRYNYYKNNPTGHYFDRDTLSFFGERFSEMKVLQKTVRFKDYNGVAHECYVLSSVQHKAPGGPARHYAYFDVETFDHIID